MSELEVESACQVCGNSPGNRVVVAREMMFGLREEFPYLECAACGCVQLARRPSDLSAYYPAGYYSYQPPRRSRWKQLLNRRHLGQILGRPSLLGRLLALSRGTPPLVERVRRAGTGFDSPILDVGSGAGELLLKMRSAGFEDLTGIDPYLDRDLQYPNGVTVLKRELATVDRGYAFIMLHHSFEHMPRPLEALRDLRRALLPRGVALLRIPVAGT